MICKLGEKATTYYYQQPKVCILWIVKKIRRRHQNPTRGTKFMQCASLAHSNLRHHGKNSRLMSWYLDRLGQLFAAVKKCVFVVDISIFYFWEVNGMMLPLELLVGIKYVLSQDTIYPKDDDATLISFTFNAFQAWKITVSWRNLATHYRQLAIDS